jgi:putative RNA 2'-phosphotransferase
MTSDRNVSRFVSYVLRHNPDEAGRTLDAGGGALVEALTDCAPLDPERIAEVVAGSDKQRFALSPDGRRIRANQGHSFAVDLGLTPETPPETLYHRTTRRALDAILSEGLLPRSRQHVHLSGDPETARAVGMRHGSPAVLTVAAGHMHARGHIFLRSANGVWLTDRAPFGFLGQI